MADELQHILHSIGETSIREDLEFLSTLDACSLSESDFNAVVDALQDRLILAGLKDDFEPTPFGISVDEMIGQLLLRRRQQVN